MCFSSLSPVSRNFFFPLHIILWTVFFFPGLFSYFFFLVFVFWLQYWTWRGCIDSNVLSSTALLWKQNQLTLVDWNVVWSAILSGRYSVGTICPWRSCLSRSCCPLVCLTVTGLTWAVPAHRSESVLQITWRFPELFCVLGQNPWPEHVLLAYFIPCGYKEPAQIRLIKLLMHYN